MDLPAPTEGNVMRIFMLILTAFLVGAASAAQAQAVIDVEGQRAAPPQVHDPGQAPPQAPLQAQENPKPPASGRYSFNRVDDGLLRLDNESGEVAYCSARAAGWACAVVAIDRSASDAETAGAQKQAALLGKLDAAIAQLHDEVASLRKEIADLRAPPPPRPPAGLTAPADKGSDVSVKLPTQQDVARAKDYLEGAWRRLVEMIVSLQKDIMRKG
jgi:hypothetical protein